MRTTVSGGDGWLIDDAAGPLVRPYGVSNGRTEPSHDLGLLSVVAATGAATTGWDPDQAQALQLCRHPIEVAQVASRMRLPAVVAKVVLSDLIDAGALTVCAAHLAANPHSRDILEDVLNGLRRL